MSAIRVLIGDDHALVRAGIRSLLEGLDGVTVVAEARQGLEALALIRRHRPHVALVDIAMPELNGIELVAEVERTEPSTSVVILSMHATEMYVRRALSAGASGYLLKDAAVSELETAVRAVAHGQSYLSPAVSSFVIKSYVRPGTEEPSELDRLTPRQREVLQLIAEGYATKEIAQRLGIGIRTVETYRAQLMKQLDIHDVAGLVRYAIRAGLISPETGSSP